VQNTGARYTDLDLEGCANIPAASAAERRRRRRRRRVSD
jgi:hypothetical protein